MCAICIIYIIYVDCVNFLGPLPLNIRNYGCFVGVVKKNNYKHGFSCFESSTRHASKLDNLRKKKIDIACTGETQGKSIRLG